MPLAVLAMILSLVVWPAAFDQDGQLEYDRDIDRQAHLAKAERVYPAIERTDIMSFETEDDLAAALRPPLLAYAKESGTTLEDAALNDLIDQAAGMLWHRFAQDDPAAYAQWRVDRGYRWVNAGEASSWYIVSDWSYWFGEEPWPGHHKIDEAWTRFWNRENEAGPALTVSALATRNPACALATSVVTPDSDDYYPLFPETDDMAWALAHAGGLRSWFVAPVPGVRDMLERDGKVTTARVGILCEWNDGKVRPLYLVYARDADGRWWLQGVAVASLYKWTRPLTEF